MDRRAAGALLALAACFACSAAAPTASNQTAIDLYEGAREGCYYNFQHYGEGDRIMTNEPCLNCTCHNRMLMCYLRVCPFTKAIGQDCTVEKRADQCCPIVTCPDVPVDLLTSTSTTSPAEYGATGIGKLDKYGCSISGKYFPEGSKVPPTPNKPCEHCYCIRNMTTCVMQECTLHVDGCTPIYHKDVCCPVRYSCDHPEDELPLLDDMSTTVRPTPGFLLTTTTMAPVTQMTQDCVHDDRVFSDGALIRTEKACEHCYCMKGDIVCVVQECGAPMENEGKNCTSLPPREGQCCPDTYICEGDELPSDLSSETTTESVIDKLTTLLPPRRPSIEGSGYRNEPDEASYTEMPIVEPDVEGSGDEEETSKPIGSDDISSTPGDDDQYIYVTTKRPAHEEHEKTTVAIDEDKTFEPHVSTSAPITDEVEKLTTGGIVIEDTSETHKYPTTKAPEIYESATTELGDLQNTVPNVIPDEEIGKPHEYAPSTTYAPTSESQLIEDKDDKLPTSQLEQDVTTSTSTKSEYNTTSSSTSDDIEKVTATPTDISNVTPEVITEKEYSDGDITKTTIATSDEKIPEEDKETSKPDLLAVGTTISPAEEDKETSKPDLLGVSTTSSPAEEEKEASKPDILAISTTISPAEEGKGTSKPDLLGVSTTSSQAEEDKETSKPDLLGVSTTISPAEEEKQSLKPEEFSPSTTSSPVEEEKESTQSELTPITTSSPLEEEEKMTTEPDHAQNTVAVAEEDSKHPHAHIPTTTAPHVAEQDSTTVSNLEPEIVTEKVIKEDAPSPTEPVTTAEPIVEVTEFTTAEPDRGLNTIPSEFYEETSSESSLPGKTTLSETTRLTEPSIITDEQQTQDVDIKSTSISELTTPESIVTKVDQYTVTTEPSFRKEDEVIGYSTEKPKEMEPTTVKSEFVEDGLIPTSSHDDKPSTSSDVPTIEDEFTTSVPEYITEIAETVEAKQTTTESPKETSVITEIVSEKVPDHDGDLPSSTEKVTEITPLVEAHEEPSRIPGEGDCLLNGVTYRNNTVVPSTNNCHTGCRCASSIIKCDPIICSPPPDYMDNCQSIYDSPDSCCPTFVCDHPRETVPPQSDNQMSGTESPMPSPTIECRGDQCEIIEATKQPISPSEPCTSGSCLPAADHQTETECGSGGCGDVPQKPDTYLPSVDPTQECADGKCKPETQVSPVTPCEGENCEKTDEVVSESPQQCKNGEDCKTLEIPTIDVAPCEGESCNKIDCGDGGCGSDVITSSPDHQRESCKEEDGCKPQDIPIPECTGNEPCRRKETSDSDAKPPTTCEGPNCISEKETTEQTPSAEATEKIVPTEGETVIEKPEDHSSKPVDEKIPVKDAQEIDTFTTERQIAETVTSTDIEKEKPVVEDEDKPTIDEEKETETPTTIDEGDKEKPVPDGEITVTEKEVTETLDVIEKETITPATVSEEGDNKPTVDEEKSTKKPVIVEDKVTEEPSLAGDEGKDKPAVIDEESTEIPTLDIREGTEKTVDEESTKEPDIIDESDTAKPVTDEESTKKPALIDEDVNEKPVIDEDSPKQPAVVVDDNKDKPTIDEESTKEPAIIDEESTKEPAMIDDAGKEKPVIDEESTKQPAIIDEDVKDKPVVDKESTKQPDIIDKENKEKPVIDGESTHKPEEEGTTKPVITEEDRTTISVTEEIATDAPTIIDQLSTSVPAVADTDTEKPSIIDETSKDKPGYIEKDTDKPTIGEDGKQKPTDVDEKDKDKPGKEPIVETSSKIPDLEEESTVKPAVGDESTETPGDIKEETTIKAAVTDEYEKEKPDDSENELTEKPTDVEEKGTETPLVTEDGEKKPVFTEDGTEKPVIIDGGLTEKPIADDKEEGTEIPAFGDKEITEKPVVKQDDKEAAVDDQDSTEQPVTSDYSKPEKTPEIDDDHKDKPIVEDNTFKPDLVDENKSSERPDIDEGTDKPTIGDKDTDKPALVDEDDKEIPDVVETESTKKPTDIDREDLPATIGEENTKKPDITEEEDIKKPVTEEDTAKPFTIEEESTAIPDITEEEGTAKPVIIDESTEEPTIIEKEDPTKTTIIEKEGTELPAMNEEQVTEKPAIIDEEFKEKPDLADQDGTKAPAIVEEGTLKPDVSNEGTEEPSIFETEGTDKPIYEKDAEKPISEKDAEKPVIVEDKDQKIPAVDKEGEKPLITDKEVTGKPAEKEVLSTEEPKTDEKEESSTKIPEVPYTVEPEKEEKSPEITVQHTEPTITEMEKTTKTPYSEYQTTFAPDDVHAYTTESNDVKPIDIDVSTPETKVTEDENSYSKEPVIHDHTRVPEITTEPPSEQEITTKKSITDHDKATISEQDVEVTTFKVETTDVKEEGSTVGQDLISQDPTLVTEAPELHKTSESLEETTETGSIDDQGDVSTDTSDIESTATKAPVTGPVIIEPQDGAATEKPEQIDTSKSEEESTTKLYEEDKMKPVPESHVTEASSTSPDYETSDGITDVSPTIDDQKHDHKPESPEHGTEPHEKTTQVPLVEIKTDHPEIHSSEKEATVTETSEYSVTEPTRGYTEIEDPSVTGQEDIVTGYPDHYVPSSTDRIDESGDDDISSSEKPLLTDMESELPEKSTTSDKFVTKMPEPDYQTPEKEKPIDGFETPVTEIPISVVTVSQQIPDVPDKHVTSYLEKTTTIPDLSGDEHKGTTAPEGYTKQQEPVTTTEEEEIKDTQTITTEKEGEAVTTAPEQMHTESASNDLDQTEPSTTEKQKVSTDLPVDELHTELPGVQPSSEVPQSLVTEQQETLGEQTTVTSVTKEESSYKPELLPTQSEDISKAPEKHIPGQEETQTDAPIRVSEPVEVSTKEKEDEKIDVPGAPVTEKQEIATTLRESPAVTEKMEQTEVMHSTEHTSAQTEFSETTPYLIELDIHTHKIVDDLTTVSPSDEDHSYKPEVISTPPPSEEEHSYKPLEDISTSAPTEEEHSQTPVEDISTSLPSEDKDVHKPVEVITTLSPSEEEHSLKPVEDISTLSPSDEEHSYKPVEDISTISPTKEEDLHKPVEDITTSLPSEEEHSLKPVEDISTLSPSDEEHSYKPVEDISTISPTKEEDLHKPVEDITTSSPSEEEHSLKPVEDISTSSPSDEEHSYKPVEDISTIFPTKVEDLHKPVEDITTSSPSEEDHSIKPVEDTSASSPSEEEYTPKIDEHVSTSSPFDEKPTTVLPIAGEEPTTKKTDEDIETSTKDVEGITKPSEESLPADVSEKVSESVPVEDTTPAIVQGEDDKYTADHKEYTTSAPSQTSEESTPVAVTDSDKLPTSESDIAVPTEKEISTSEKPSHTIVSHETTAPEEEFIFSTTKPTTVHQGDDIASSGPDADKYAKPEEKPSETSEIPASSTTTEVSKPSIPDLQPTEEVPVPEDDGHFPPSGTSGYGEPDYVDEDQAFGPGTCRYGGKVYVSAQQIPRDDPCDFCFCFRSDIICLQQSCPPPIHGCHEEPIQGFCCPRYECPVSMATTVNVTTTTTTTTTTLPPHFPTHSYKGAAQRRGCQIKGHTYKVGEVVRSSSGPCLHCTCGGDGQMKCDPKACTPEPMLRQMIAAAVSAKRRR